MNAMALLALESRESPIETIKGILLLCMWPIPMNTMHKDISHVLSGAAVHLGMQIGLHITGSGQDFARGRLNRSQAQKIDRAHLWMYCLMVLHRHVYFLLIRVISPRILIQITAQASGRDCRPS